MGVRLSISEAVQPVPLVIQPNLIFCERGKEIGRGDPFEGHGTNETKGLAYEPIAADERPNLFSSCSVSTNACK